MAGDASDGSRRERTSPASRLRKICGELRRIALSQPQGRRPSHARTVFSEVFDVPSPDSFAIVRKLVRVDEEFGRLEALMRETVRHRPEEWTHFASRLRQRLIEIPLDHTNPADIFAKAIRETDLAHLDACIRRIEEGPCEMSLSGEELKDLRIEIERLEDEAEDLPDDDATYLLFQRIIEILLQGVDDYDITGSRGLNESIHNVLEEILAFQSRGGDVEKEDPFWRHIAKAISKVEAAAARTYAWGPVIEEHVVTVISEKILPLLLGS